MPAFFMSDHVLTRSLLVSELGVSVSSLPRRNGSSIGNGDLLTLVLVNPMCKIFARLWHAWPMRKSMGLRACGPQRHIAGEARSGEPSEQLAYRVS